MKQLERVKDKFNKLKNIDKDYKIFGSEYHKYTFAPVLSEAEVLAFENEHNLTLPDDYKSFLMEIGNGGAGPFYGLLSLEDNEDQFTNLYSDFEFTREKPCLLEKYDEYDEKIENAETDEEEQVLWDLKDSLIEKEYMNAVKGITFLCHEGCGMFNVLILKGKDAGTVWWFNFSDQVGVVPVLYKEKQVNFLDWYEMWLDESLDYLKNGKKSFSTYGEFVGLDNMI